MTYLENFRSGRLNLWLQRILRVFQFLSSIISLAVFSSRIAKILRLARLASRADGAVEGILAAASLYTLGVMLLQCCLSHGGPRPLRWTLVLLDILFIGGFIAVAYLTNPNDGPSGPCTRTGQLATDLGANDCNLPWATFILAIVST